MKRSAVLALLIAAGCAPDGRDAPVASETAPGPDAASALPSIADVARLDTLTIDADAPALDRRPRAPLRVDGACPFEGCQYGAWTTSDSTTVYAAADTTSAAFRIPAGVALNADRGFVLLTRLGRAVAQRATEVFVAFEERRPVAAGDTLFVLDYEGEGSFRVWTDGTLAFSDGVSALSVRVDGSPLRVLDEPRPMWWAHVTLPDGRSGWLWMDRTPPVDGADRFAG